MLTDIEIRKKGLKVLIDALGNVNAEKFISLIIKEPFDYTEWQCNLWKDFSVGQINDRAMKYRKSKEEELKHNSNE
jgi:hypothetical protein